MSATATRRPTVAVLGGAVAGLAAAERFSGFADVILFERQSYATKRVNCGEAFTEASLVPLDQTAENGFHNRVSGFDVHIDPSMGRDTTRPPLASATVTVDDGYITDRNVVERRWAERLRMRGIDVREGVNVSRERYDALVDEYDYVVDATGQPALSLRLAGQTDAYTGAIVALNADVEGEFSRVRNPQILFEGYVGYFWVFPKSATRANVGIGWAMEDRPENSVEALWAACDRAGVTRPPRDAINAYTIPRGPSLAPRLAHPAENVFLVGDAAGIANRYQGEGIAQAIRSAYLLADLVEAGDEADYPVRLYQSMKAEYRLATLMHGIWETTEDPVLLADVTRAIDGLSVVDVSRRPRRVYARLLRRPILLTRLLAVPGLRRRLVAAYTDTWEYGRGTTSERPMASAQQPLVSPPERVTE